MTGLDLEHDELVEVAALVTDGQLNVLGEGIDVIIKPSAPRWSRWATSSAPCTSTPACCPSSTAALTLAEAEERVLDYIRTFVPEPRRAPLAGNSIGTDRAFLAVGMPALESYVHYRNVDVSSVKELARRWFPRAYYAAPAKTGNHRALADVQESIEELRYYRDAVFVPLPGPDSATARAIAARHQAALTGATAGTGVRSGPTRNDFGAPASGPLHSSLRSDRSSGRSASPWWV